MRHIGIRATKLAFSTALLGILALPAASQAMDTFFVGPRAMGMAGANVASPVDTSAQYYNPAAFGFFGRTETIVDEKGRERETRSLADNNNIARKDWGWDVVYAGGGYRAHKDLGDVIQNLSDVDLGALQNDGIKNEDDLRAVVNLANDLNLLQEKGNGLTAMAQGGSAFRVGSFALGVRGYGQGAAWVANVDTSNLGLDKSAVDLSVDIKTVAESAGYNTNIANVSFLTAAQITTLQGVGFTDEAIAAIDDVARREGITQSEIAPFVSTLESIASSSGGGGGGDLSQNTTTVAVTGFGLAEVPLSYGYAFNEHFSLGGNLKLMVGRVYGTQLLVFGNDNEDLLSKTEEQYEQTVNFGVDLGAMARFRWVQFGLVGRNLNSPEFKGPKITNDNGSTTKFDDVTVKPQLQAGVAFIPFETVTIEVDCDVIKNRTALPGYDTQYIRAGVEWDILRVLALRGGVYNNLAEDDIGLVYTLGLGLNLWAVRFDVAGAFSADTFDYDGKEYPKEAQIVAGLSIDF